MQHLAHLIGLLEERCQASEGSSVPVETSLLRSAVDGLRQAGSLAEQLEEANNLLSLKPTLAKKLNDKIKTLQAEIEVLRSDTKVNELERKIHRLEDELKQSYATKNFTVKSGLLEIEKKYRHFIYSSHDVEELWAEVTLLLVDPSDRDTFSALQASAGRRARVRAGSQSGAEGSPAFARRGSAVEGSPATPGDCMQVQREVVRLEEAGVVAVLPSEPAPLYPRTASSHGPALTPDARSCDSLTETDLPFASGLVSDPYAGPCDVLPLPGAPTGAGAGSSGRPVPLAYGEADASALITQAEVIAACVGKLRQLFARTDGPLPVPAPDGTSGRRSGSGRTSLSGLVPDATYFDAQVDDLHVSINSLLDLYAKLVGQPGAGSTGVISTSGGVAGTKGGATAPDASYCISQAEAVLQSIQHLRQEYAQRLAQQPGGGQRHGTAAAAGGMGDGEAGAAAGGSAGAGAGGEEWEFDRRAEELAASVTVLREMFASAAVSIALTGSAGAASAAAPLAGPGRGGPSELASAAAAAAAAAGSSGTFAADAGAGLDARTGAAAAAGGMGAAGASAAAAAAGGASASVEGGSRGYNLLPDPRQDSQQYQDEGELLAETLPSEPLLALFTSFMANLTSKGVLPIRTPGAGSAGRGSASGAASYPGQQQLQEQQDDAQSQQQQQQQQQQLSAYELASLFQQYLRAPGGASALSEAHKEELTAALQEAMAHGVGVPGNGNAADEAAVAAVVAAARANEGALRQLAGAWEEGAGQVAGTWEEAIGQLAAGQAALEALHRDTLATLPPAAALWEDAKRLQWEVISAGSDAATEVAAGVRQQAAPLEAAAYSAAAAVEEAAQGQAEGAAAGVGAGAGVAGQLSRGAPTFAGHGGWDGADVSPAAAAAAWDARTSQTRGVSGSGRVAGAASGAAGGVYGAAGQDAVGAAGEEVGWTGGVTPDRASTRFHTPGGDEAAASASSSPAPGATPAATATPPAQHPEITPAGDDDEERESLTRARAFAAAVRSPAMASVPSMVLPEDEESVADELRRLNSTYAIQLAEQTEAIATLSDQHRAAVERADDLQFRLGALATETAALREDNEVLTRLLVETKVQHAETQNEYMRLQQRLKRSLQQEHNIRDENEELRLRMKELGVPSGSEGGAPPHLVHTPDASVHAQQPQGASATAGAGGLPRQGSGAGWARTGLAHSNSKGGASPHDKALTQSPTLAHGIATAP